jgi:flagellar FliL protein
MARKKKDDTAGDAPAADKKAKGGKNNLIPAIVVAVGLLGAGYFMSGGGGGKAATAAAAGEPTAAGAAGAAGTTATTVAGGETVSTGDPITLNLADGRFLKVAIALQLAKGVSPEHFTPAASAKAIDAAISFLGSKSYAELAVPGARDAAKAELSKKIAELYEKEVLSVYFTQFVMQ